MGACHRSGIHKVACGLPSLVRSIALVAVAAAATAVVTGAAEMTSVASSGAAAQSIVMPQNGDVRLHRSTPLDLVARQPLDGFEPSAIRRLQRQRRRSQNVAVSAGLVAVVCLAVAFAVFQCARKALLPRLFGSPGKRALSDSDSDEHSVDVCIEEEIDESDGSSGGAEARPTEVAGEATALEALEELRSLITLGVQTAPHVPAESRGVLVVLLLTVCTQELALYGVYSTPQIEVERQRAIDFVLQEGAHALAQLDTLQAYFTVRRGRDMLELLQRFREAPANADSGGLAVEATISEYRIKQCSYALQQLQPWVQRFTSIPMQVVRAALKLVSCVRHSGKRRLKQDKGASAWVETVQAAHGFFGIAEPAYRRKFCRPPKTLAEEMGEGSRRYHQFRTQLDSSVQLAFALQQPGQRMLEQPQKREQQQLQELEPPQQQHPEIPGEGVTPSHPSRPPSGARRRSSSATTSSVLRPPTLQSTQSPRADSHRHIPTAHPERLEHPPSWSAPRRKKTLQETNEQQQPSPASSTLDSGLRAGASEFIHSQPKQRDAQQQRGRMLLLRRSQQPVPVPLQNVEGEIPSQQSPLPSAPPSGARRRSSSATTSSLLRPPHLQSTQPPRTDTHQHTPTAHPERRFQPPPLSAPGRQMTPQAAKEQEQTSLDSSTVDSGLRAEAPEFKPRQPPDPEQQQHVAIMPFVASGGWPTAPPPLGFALLHQPANPSTADHSGAAFPRPLWMPPQHHAAHLLTMFPQPAPAPHTLTPVEHLQSAPQALPGPFYYPPGPLMPTGEPSSIFPRPMFQPPPPEIPQQGFTHPHALPGGWQHIPVQWIFAPAGHPIPVTVEALSTADTASPLGAEQRHREAGGRPRRPPSHPPPHQYTSGTSADAAHSVPMPTQSEGEDASADTISQTQEGAEWGLGGERGDGSTQA